MRAKLDTRKTTMVCIECGKKFRKVVTPRTVEVQCPKCGGYDVEVL